jgi:hypothetical protein
MWSKIFWIAVSERSIKTVAQTAAALLVGFGTGLLEVDYIGNDGPSLAGEDLEQ